MKDKEGFAAKVVEEAKKMSHLAENARDFDVLEGEEYDTFSWTLNDS